MQLEAISSCLVTNYLGEETNAPLTTTSFQVALESNKVSPQPSFLQTKQSQLPQLLLVRLVLWNLHQHHCSSLDTLQHCTCSEGPKTEHSTPGVTSPVLSRGGRSPPYSCWPHYSWYKPGCHWPLWPPGHTAGSCSAGCWPAPPGPFPPVSFPATLPQACSVAWGCCDPCAGPGTRPCWTSYNWPQPIDPACPDQIQLLMSPML